MLLKAAEPCRVLQLVVVSVAVAVMVVAAVAMPMAVSSMVVMMTAPMPISVAAATTMRSTAAVPVTTASPAPATSVIRRLIGHSDDLEPGPEVSRVCQLGLKALDTLYCSQLDPHFRPARRVSDDLGRHNFSRRNLGSKAKSHLLHRPPGLVGHLHDQGLRELLAHGAPLTTSRDAGEVCRRGVARKGEITAMAAECREDQTQTSWGEFPKGLEYHDAGSMGCRPFRLEERPAQKKGPGSHSGRAPPRHPADQAPGQIPKSKHHQLVAEGGHADHRAGSPQVAQ
jgi:hypothetical protein